MRFLQPRPSRHGVTPRFDRLLILPGHLRGIVALHDGLPDDAGRCRAATFQRCQVAAAQKHRRRDDGHINEN